jgi:S-layer protein (TIGR01567 family)
MINTKSSGANAPVTRIVLTMIAILFMAGSVYAETTLWDESQGSPLPFTWNATNSDVFVGTENLAVLQTDLNTVQRTIGAGNLTYSTTAQVKKLNAVIALNLIDNQAMTDKGLAQAAPGKAFDNGEYYAVTWWGERYVAINRTVNKLAKLLMEQGLSDNKTMVTGETWDIGEGWALKVNSIDARANPRQVSMTLYKDGITKDEILMNNARPIYTYVENISGEIDVPVLVTYVDSISSNATSDFVRFGGTWVLSESVNIIQSGSAYGIFSDAMVVQNTLSLRNSATPVNLSPNATIGLNGNMKFYVINDTKYLKFSPSPQLIPTPIPSVYFDSQNINLPKNSSRSVNLILNNISNGLSGYNITISLSNASVASFGSIDFPAWAVAHLNGSLSSGSVWIKAADLNHQIENSTQNVILANVTVKGEIPGYTKVTITIGKMDDDSGTVIKPQTLVSYIKVNNLKMFPTTSAYPGDLDGDGLYEDINGNGIKDLDDVVLFFYYLEWAVNNEPIASFDFNQNGRLDFADIVELYGKLPDDAKARNAQTDAFA